MDRDSARTAPGVNWLCTCGHVRLGASLLLCVLIQPIRACKNLTRVLKNSLDGKLCNVYLPEFYFKRPVFASRVFISENLYFI